MTDTRPYRVVQWATGNIGSHSLRAVIAHPDLDLVGLYVYSEGKAGRDAGDLCGTAPTGVLATRDLSDPDATLRYRKVLQLMKDMKTQGATLLVLATEGDEEAAALANHCIEVPKTEDMLATMLEVVPLQLLAYQLAIQAGIDVDKPRNLTKAVLHE